MCPVGRIGGTLSSDPAGIMSSVSFRVSRFRPSGRGSDNWQDLRPRPAQLLAAAERLGLKVVRVPAYSPHAVAEHAMGMILTLNRKFHRAYARVREGNFSLEGLLGFDLCGRTVGVVGTGQIGAVFAQSSTTVISKQLTEQAEENSRHGRLGLDRRRARRRCGPCRGRAGTRRR